MIYVQIAFTFNRKAIQGRCRCKCSREMIGADMRSGNKE